MLVSVIIPMYNGAQYISSCIDSVLGQGLSTQVLEIIVIDDVSTDDGPTIVKDIIKRNENVILLQQPNQGLGMTRNRGAEIAKGEWLHFVDCDDTIPLNAYRSILKQLENKNVAQADVVAFNSVKIVDGKQFRKVSSTGQVQFNGTFFDYVNKYGFKAPVWSYWIKSNFWKEKNVRFRKLHYTEDVMFNVELFHNYDSRICVIDTLGYNYITRQNSLTTSQSASRLEQAIRNMADIYSNIFTIMQNSRYKSDRFSSPLRWLSQPALTRLITGKFSYDKRKELINYCISKKIFPLNGLLSSRVEKMGNFLLKHPLLIRPVSFVYRKIFIPYVKPRIDSHTGRFMFKKKLPV